MCYLLIIYTKYSFGIEALTVASKQNPANILYSNILNSYSQYQIKILPIYYTQIYSIVTPNTKYSLSSMKQGGEGEEVGLFAMQWQ